MVTSSSGSVFLRVQALSGKLLQKLAILAVGATEELF
jgi:hypothetical protein